MLRKVRLICETSLANTVTVLALCTSAAPYFDMHIAYQTKGNELFYMIRKFSINFYEVWGI